jgi:hypothetical protein
MELDGEGSVPSPAWRLPESPGRLPQQAGDVPWVMSKRRGHIGHESEPLGQLAQGQGACRALDGPEILLKRPGEADITENHPKTMPQAWKCAEKWWKSRA